MKGAANFLISVANLELKQLATSFPHANLNLACKWVSCLLPFCLLKIRLCHFAYSTFLTLRQTFKQLSLLQQGVKGALFMHFAQALNQRISMHTWASFIDFTCQTVVPVFVPLWFVQLAWKQPRLQFLICSQSWWVLYILWRNMVGGQYELLKKAHPNVYKHEQYTQKFWLLSL